MAKITTKADLNDGTEFNIVLGSAVTLNEAGNLTEADGVTGKALFSALSDAWKANATANQYRFPFAQTVGELATLFEFRGGYTLTSGDETFIRDSGVRYTSDFEGQTVTKEFCCLVQAGSIDSAEQPYILQGSNTVPTNLNFAGQFNELVEVFDSGGDDNRDMLKVFIRTQGRTYGYYDLTTEQALSTILPIAYLIPMSTEVDTNGSGADGAIQSDVFITSNTPYTGMGPSGDGSDLFETITGNGFSVATVGSLALNDVRQDTAGRWFICTTAGTIDAAGVADYTNNGGTATLSSYSGEREIDGSFYAYNKIIDGNSGTKQQIWEFHQYMLRQTTDIDSSANTSRGDTTLNLMDWEGTTLVTSTGVYIDNVQASQLSEYIFVDVGGVRRQEPFQLTASVTNLTANSRLQVYNVTTASEVVNQIVTGTSYTASYLEGTGYNSGDELRIRVTFVDGATAKLEWSATTVATAAGWSVIAAQEDDTVYNNNALDGSAITKFSADYLNDEIDLIVTSNFTAAEVYAFYVYNNYTALGGATAIDDGNYVMNSNVLSIFFDSTVTTSVRQTDTARLYRSDGVYPVKSPTTSGYGIDVNWRVPVFVTEVNTGSAVNQATVQAALTAQGFTTGRAPNLDNLDAETSKALTTSKFLALK